ncbi:hypothetical protein HMPREF9511_02877 [Enterococcus faecalis TX0630]|uniref:Uncharacterized protein n=1 Tax=Enterococcus faecalis TX0630 TaxID=749508 RepID=A0ABC9P2L6_ENTFL|nr:hypothetical protein HMPREF9511_02877 [Enterococcus faecalis TX0630]
MHLFCSLIAVFYVRIINNFSHGDTLLLQEHAYNKSGAAYFSLF